MGLTSLLQASPGACMCLDFRRKLEHLNANTGSKLHTERIWDSNPEPPGESANRRTTMPPAMPHIPPSFARHIQASSSTSYLSQLRSGNRTSSETNLSPHHLPFLLPPPPSSPSTIPQSHNLTLPLPRPLRAPPYSLSPLIVSLECSQKPPPPLG